ncbi:hypothetical protein [Brachyspira sp. SAP_772]|uniref:hypothetical protein n=1 Tax=Brachyspira sp. SAP_772 TaxID=2608385 RepID=UPI0012F520DE|nr:hypothetical protein [Brachyspira sp. SAP_772]
MKNKNIFLKIYIVFVVILTISVIVLYILGKKERVGYLSEFNINLNKTLEINGLDVEETKELFTVDNELDDTAITNYIFTNTSITNYSYDFRIKYYSKVFRHGDLYGVYPNLNNLPKYIQSAKMGDRFGTPFGNLASTKILDIDKIDNIKYVLKLKYNIIFACILTCIVLSLMFIYIYNIHNFIHINTLLKRDKIVFIVIFVVILLIVVLALLGKKERVGYLSEFKLNVNNTLEINGLDKEETKQLFTIDNKLDNTAFTNYIFTNNSITNYSYDFRIKYYSKIFRNSYLYGVYPNLNNLPEYVQLAKMNDRSGTPFGSLISTKELKNDDKINTKYYLLINFDIFYYIAIIFIITLLCVGFYLLQEYWKYKKTLDKKDYLFVNKIELVGILLFAFQYWMFYPGYFGNWDTWRAITQGVYYPSLSSNWHPIILDLSIAIIDKIGLTMSVFLFINLFLWYISISAIIISIYIKTKNKLIILLFLISFILQIFLYNIEYLKDSVSTLYVIFSYSIAFFIIMTPLKNKNKTILKIISLLSLIIGMLHRHNFIVTVYPILIWFTYDYLKTKNIASIKKYLFSFTCIMFINAIILMGIYFIFPRIFIKNITKTATYHIYNLQIACCLVPANDSSLIPENWWGENKSFKDLVEQYNKDPFYGDPILNDRIFVAPSTSELKKVWIKSILKYPKNYIKYMFNYIKAMWTLEYRKMQIEQSYTKEYTDKIISKMFDRGLRTVMNSSNDFKDTKFYKENQEIKFTELKKSIFDFLIIIMPNINVFLFILISIILFFVSGIFLLLKKEFINSILIFTFSVSFSSVATAIIVAVFTPVVVWYQYRYIYPVIPISILSLIGFITFIYDRGGFKKFIKELRGNK